MPESLDRRRVERLPVNAHTTCSFVSPVSEDSGPAKIKDVSPEGVGLVVTRRVEVGALLAVTLTNESRGLSRTMLVRVAHVTPQHGGFLVGGSFTAPLSYEELTKFVM